jgi:glycosyltransferase involved in cell wall biosynthesis
MKLRELVLNEKNIKIYPSVSDEDYSPLLASADVLLLNERESQIDMSLPSKLTSYLLSGRPIIAAVPMNGASSKFLHGIACLVDPGKPKVLAEAILNLQSNKEMRFLLGREGVRFANELLGSNTGRASYLSFVDSLLFQD